MDKEYKEIQKKLPDLVKMKRKYLKEKMEKEYYKNKISIHKEEIAARDVYIWKLEELLKEQEKTNRELISLSEKNLVEGESFKKANSYIN